MPRTRNLKPGFFKNEDLLDCDPLTRLLFAGLWCWADREGRLEDRPRRLKVDILPADNCDVGAMLQQLAERGLIVRYEAAGARYIEIPNFGKHQNPHQKEPGSTYPPSPKSPGQAPDKPRAGPGQALGETCSDRANHSPLTTHHSSKEEEYCSELAKPASEPKPCPKEKANSQDDRVVMVFVVKGTTKEWHLTQSVVAGFKEAFPDLDVLAEMKRAEQWLLANPEKKKTAAGMQKYLLGWLGRSQDRGNGRSNGTLAPRSPGRAKDEQDLNDTLALADKEASKLENERNGNDRPTPAAKP